MKRYNIIMLIIAWSFILVVGMAYSAVVYVVTNLFLSLFSGDRHVDYLQVVLFIAVVQALRYRRYRNKVQSSFKELQEKLND